MYILFQKHIKDHSVQYNCKNLLLHVLQILITQKTPEKNSLSDCLTFFLVEHQLGLELPAVIQRSLDLGCRPVARFRAVQEVTCAALLHELSTGITGKLTEAIRAVDDGVEGLNLGISQNKVAICGRRLKSSG